MTQTIEFRRENTEQPQSRPQREVAKTNTLVTNVAELLQKIRERIKGSSTEHKTGTIFDLGTFDKLQDPKTYIELGPPHLQYIGEVYSTLLMDPRALIDCYKGNFELAEQRASGGGMIHRFHPQREEDSARDDYPPTKDVRYISPREEMELRMQGQFPFNGGEDVFEEEFRVYGAVLDGKLAGIVSCGFPPKDPNRRDVYGEQAEQLLTRGTNNEGSQVENVHARRNGIMEIDICAVLPEYPGLGTALMHKVDSVLKEEQHSVTDIRLVRFGGMIPVYPAPVPSQHITPEEGNNASNEFFRKFGFRNFGHYTSPHDVAFRTIPEDLRSELPLNLHDVPCSVIGVQPQWNKMHTRYSTFTHKVHEQWAALQARAKQARKLRR